MIIVECVLVIGAVIFYLWFGCFVGREFGSYEKFVLKILDNFKKEDEMTVTEYREQKKEQAKQLSKHTKGDLADKLLFAYDTIRRLEAQLQKTSSNSDYAKCKLYECPYDKSCTCDMTKPCKGCETWAKYVDKI